MGDLLPIRVREALWRRPMPAQRKTALDAGCNVVVIPDREEPGIVARLREALIAEWHYAPQ